MPQIEEGDASVTAKMKMKIWELAYIEYTKITVKYEQEKRKVYAIMIGQMSESSKNRVSEISEGAVAMESEDPKGFLAAIIVTHMHDSRLGVMQNLCKAELAYTNTTMHPGETVIHYYQKSLAIIASLEQAHKRADNIVDEVMPKEEQRAVRFILGLSSEYISYQQYFRDSLREWPDSLENAFVDASKFTPFKYSQKSPTLDSQIFSMNGRRKVRSKYKGRGRSDFSDAAAVAVAAAAAGKSLLALPLYLLLTHPLPFILNIWLSDVGLFCEHLSGVNFDASTNAFSRLSGHSRRYLQ